MEDRLLTRKEAAEFLRCSVIHLHRLTKCGEISCIKRGKYIRYRIRDLLAFLDKYTTRKEN